MKRELIICGDFNLAASEEDTSEPAAWSAREKELSASHQTASEWFRSVKKTFDLVDAFRYYHAEESKAFTHWCTLSGTRATNCGTRLDYVLADRQLVERFGIACEHLTDVQGSDHAPVVFTFSTTCIPSTLRREICTLPLCAARLPTAQFTQNTLKDWTADNDSKTKDHFEDLNSPTSEVLTLLPPETACEPLKPLSGPIVLPPDHLKSRPTATSPHQTTASTFPSVKSPLKISSPAKPSESPLKRKTTPSKSSRKRTQPLTGQQTLLAFYKKAKLPPDPSPAPDSATAKVPLLTPKLSNTTNDNPKQPAFLLQKPGGADLQALDSQRLTNDATNTTATNTTATNATTTNSKVSPLLTPTPLSKEMLALMEEATKYLSHKERSTYFDIAPTAPKCPGHRLPCILRVTKKEGSNFGRKFWCCCCATGDKSAKKSRCDYFKWVGDRRKL